MKNRKQLYKIGIRTYEAECPDDEFRFQAEISNKNLDSYYSRMDDASLDNYVNDINNGGVALVNGHQYNGIENVLGTWFEAERKGDSVIATARMLRSNESTPEKLNVDEYIRRIERNILKDVSIGFAQQREICDICDNPIFEWGSSKDRCIHYPGQEYDGTICTYEVRGAHLAETSLVFDGATPGAEIITARNAPDELVEWKKGEPKTDSLLEGYGRMYQEKMINRLIRAKVRVVGHDFDEEKDRQKYLGWRVEDVMEQINVYKTAYNVTGGRKINDEGNDKPKVVQLPFAIFG